MNRNVTKIVGVTVFSLTLGSFAPLWADQSSAADKSPAQIDYGTGVGEKLGRGLGNVAFGWMEIPKGVQDVGDQRNFIAGITWGPLQGIGKALVRTAAGVYEVMTFPIPGRANFEPLVKPEFVLEDQR